MLSLILATTAVRPVQPNIVMVFSDDHARQAISAYGSRVIQTPAIDRLAQEGVRFDRHYTTNPLCAPSRASLLTGKYSNLNGITDNRLSFDGAQQTFPKLLQAAGYQTGVVGKWHLKSDPTGFDYWSVLPGQGLYYNPDFLNPGGKTTEHGYVTEIITQKAIDFLKKQGSKPFFLLVGEKAPHRNWIPGPNQMTLFNDTVFPEPATLRTDYATLVPAVRTVQMRLDKYIRPAEDLMVDYIPPRMDAEQKAAWQKAFAPQDAQYKADLAKSGDLLGTNYQRYMKEYLRCVAGVDESVKEIYDYLKSKNMLKNTVVIYASDQGFFLGENAWYDKRWFYEPSSGTPLVIRPADGLKTPRVVKSLTSNLDLAPTILELAGVKPASEMQGNSLAQVVNGQKSTTGETSVYGHFYESNDGDHHAPQYVAVTTFRHKLMYYYQLNEWELFDLATDPNETRNVWSTAPKSLKNEMVRKLLADQRKLKEDANIIQMTKSAARFALGAQ